eukprot:1159876-Pelagomonas_calceolata.AAC.2
MAKKAGIEVWLSNADTPARAHTHTHSAASSCRKSAEMAGIEVWRSDAVLMRVLLDTAAASRKLNGKGLLAIYAAASRCLLACAACPASWAESSNLLLGGSSKAEDEHTELVQLKSIPSTCRKHCPLEPDGE